MGWEFDYQHFPPSAAHILAASGAGLVWCDLCGNLLGLTRGDAYVYLNNFKLSMTFIIFLGAFFPIITSSIYAVSSIPKPWIESARVLGANEWDIFCKILLPGAAPTIVNGMRTGLGSAWTCLVSAEMLPGSLSGVGYLIIHAYEIARIDVVVIGMMSIGAIGAFWTSSSGLRKPGNLSGSIRSNKTRKP